MPMTSRTQAPADAACLVVFLKAPGRSKRRLAAEIGADATIAASHLLDCAFEDAANWQGPVVLAPAEPSDAEWLASRAGIEHDVVLQRGESLGERINSVDRALRARGLDRLIFIGADCPSLDASYLQQAEAALEHADGVLGPAADGGVVLMAARRPWPDIGTLAWSTPALLDALAACLTAANWTIASLALLTDVDEPADLAAAALSLAKDPRPARRALVDWLASRTRAATM